MAKQQVKKTEAADDADARAQEVEPQRTDDERFALIISIGGFSRGVGRDKRYPEDVPTTAGYTPGVPRLGVPALLSSDASMRVTNPGFRPDDKGATAMPASIGASFNPQLAHEGVRCSGARRASEASTSCWPKPDTYAGGPILDGKIVAGMPAEALQRRKAAKVPVLIGTTSEDLPVLFPPRENPLSFFGAGAPAAKAVYFAGGADPVQAIKNIAVDMTMHEPARFVAKQMTAAGQPVWLYRFGYVAESLRPKGTAEHSTELPYLFGTLNARYGRAATPKDRAMADIFMGYIAAFAKTGIRTAAACLHGRATTPRIPS
jgi:hypothetical protein